MVISITLHEQDIKIIPDLLRINDEGAATHPGKSELEVNSSSLNSTY